MKNLKFVFFAIMAIALLAVSTFAQAGGAADNESSVLVINIEGTGLGLNIVRKYVEMLGGDITYNSTLNEGAEFNIVLPNSPDTKEEIKF